MSLKLSSIWICLHSLSTYTFSFHIHRSQLRSNHSSLNYKDCVAIAKIISQPAESLQSAFLQSCKSVLATPSKRNQPYNMQPYCPNQMCLVNSIYSCKNSSDNRIKLFGSYSCITILPILIQRIQWTSGCKIFCVRLLKFTQVQCNSIRADARVNFTK